MKKNVCRNKKMCMFGVSLLILTLIVAAILGLLAGPDSPITWALIAILVVIPFIHRKMASGQFVEWKDEYSVGIDSIDQQHKKLLSLINQLQTAVDYSTGEQFEQEALDELVEYTKTHFTYEEGLMRDNDYPEFEPHKLQHDKMIEEVEKVLSEYEQDHDKAMSDAAEYLKDWLVNHINGTDKEYSDYLIERGVQ